MKRLSVDPPCGVLDSKESILMAVSCEAFQYGSEDTNNDRITIEWTNAPEGAAKEFRREWFQGDGMVRRKTSPSSTTLDCDLLLLSFELFACFVVFDSVIAVCLGGTVFYVQNTDVVYSVHIRVVAH